MHPPLTIEETLLKLSSDSETGLVVNGVKSIILGIAKAGMDIAETLAEAGFMGGYGTTDEVNASGEVVQKLDLFANKRIIEEVGGTGRVAVLASEEEEAVVTPPGGPVRNGYVFMFDPLDGSSNIDVNVSVGTIFSIVPSTSDSYAGNPERDALRRGREIVCAGYIVYGPATILVAAFPKMVLIFSLDASRRRFIHCGKLEKHGDAKIYSINESTSSDWFSADLNWIKSLKEGKHGKYTARYVGSLVADFHRGLLKGGVFAYPANRKSQRGKLRLLYECAPLAYIAEQAGGAASDGNQWIGDILPSELHQRSPLYIGTKEEVELAMSFQQKTW